MKDCSRKKINDFFIIGSLLFIFIQMIPVALAAGPIIDHNYTDLSLIPAQWLEQAKNDLHIAYHFPWKSVNYRHECPEKWGSL